ncbi:MAG TPA: DUF4403 family protein [Puia sp.]|nr:DUF4403 family protein [Puia sp.]
MVFIVMLPVLFASCSPAKKLTAPSLTISMPDSLPALPESEIDIPIKLAGRPLLAAADSMFPKEFTSLGWPGYLQPSCDFRYKYRFVRSGFKIRCVDNRITVGMQCNYQVAGGRSICAGGKPVSPWISGYCGFDREPMRGVDLAFNTQFMISPDYRLHTISGVEQVKALDRCTMSIFSMDITNLIMDSIRSSINAFCRIVDASATDLNVAGYLQKTAKTWQKTPIGPYGWLAINPVAMRVGTLNYARDTFSLSLGIGCRPELSSDKSPAKQFTLPPLNSGPDRHGITLYLPANYEYSFLSKLLNDSVAGRSFEYKGRQVIIQEVTIRGIGHHQLELRIDLAGSHKARLFLRGTPVVDTAKQALSVPDITFGIQSGDLMVKMARAILRGKIRRTVQGNRYLDLAALLKTNLASINAQLNRAITPYLHTNGEIKQLKLIGLLAGENSLQAQLFIQAELAVTATGLPK